MRIESTSFTDRDLDGFLADLEEADRLALAGRLERATERMAEVAGGLPPESPAGDGEAWNAREILAHIAVLSKFYGMLTYKIGRGDLTELDLAANVSQRDVLGERLSQLPAGELLEMASSDQRRTADYLRAADAAALRRRCAIGTGRSLSAAEFARLALCAHLEQHLDQLEAVLQNSR